MIGEFVERSLFSYIANRNGNFNSFFGKQYGTICPSILLFRISNIEIKTPIYNKDISNSIVYSGKKLSIGLPWWCSG